MSVWTLWIAQLRALPILTYGNLGADTADALEQFKRLVTVTREVRHKIELALCDEYADYDEWCGEVLPLIHDALAAVLREIDHNKENR